MMIGLHHHAEVAPTRQHCKCIRRAGRAVGNQPGFAGDPMALDQAFESLYGAARRALVLGDHAGQHIRGDVWHDEAGNACIAKGGTSEMGLEDLGHRYREVAHAIARRIALQLHQNVLDHRSLQDSLW